MAGIYIHIPFCKQRCHYCDFHFSTSYELYYEEMVDAIQKELIQRKDYLGKETVETIYFGGGTPSLLNAKDIKKFIELIQQEFGCNIKEITLEANPDDLSELYIHELASTGINRLSIGIQSFDDDVLKFMNRAHNSVEALNCVSWAQKTGINDISIDLIYGVPNVDEGYWDKTINQALELNVKHISAYCLTIEPGTVFGHQKKKGILSSIPEEIELDQFNELHEKLKIHGIERYEVSNFAKIGFESKHNSAYWSSTPYLGVGPSAHSFDGISRQWNVKNNTQYIKLVSSKGIYFEKEILSKKDLFNDMILTGLRTREGVGLGELINLSQDELWSNRMAVLIRAGRLVKVDGRIKIPDEFLFQADGIAADLFIFER